MLGRRIDLVGVAGRLLLQVGVSAAATLVGSMLLTTVPRPPWQAERSAAELTSGGKFAARVPNAPSETPEPPRQWAPLLAAWQPFGTFDPQPAAPIVAQPAVPDRPLRAKARLIRVVAARAGSATVTAAVQPDRVAPDLAETPAARADEGMVARLWSTAKGLGSMTASLGGSILSHVIP